MQGATNGSPWWAALTVWGVVNAVNLLQAAGFLSRIVTGSSSMNHALGRLIGALAIPALVVMIAFVRSQAGWLYWTGPAVFAVFVVFMLFVDYIRPVAFRSPVRHGILVPYLVLFFGAILLMGLPMFRLNRTLWLVTAVTTAFLLVSMGIAVRHGVA